jgi:hypothetical protein
MNRQTEQALIAEFIAKHGVTRCPTAYALPSTAQTSEADRQAHAERGIDPAGEAYRRKNHQYGWQRYWAKKKAGRK